MKINNIIMKICNYLLYYNYFYAVNNYNSPRNYFDMYISSP